MARQSARVDAPPPQTRSAGCMNSVEPAPVPIRPAAGVWCDSPYPCSTTAATFAHAVSMEKQANQAGQRKAASPGSDSHNWGNNPRPIGGFVNFLQNPSSFTFPQQIPHHAPVSTNFQFNSGPVRAHSVPPWPPMPNGVPTLSHTNLSSSHMPSGSQSQQSIDVDAPDSEEVRITK